MLTKEWHKLQDLNINLYQNGSIIGEENKNIIKGANKVSSETKTCVEFRKTADLKQLIKSATSVTSNISTLIDHILRNTNEKIRQYGPINIELSDYQMIFYNEKNKQRKSRLPQTNFI